MRIFDEETNVGGGGVNLFDFVARFILLCRKMEEDSHSEQARSACEHEQFTSAGWRRGWCENCAEMNVKYEMLPS